MTAVKVRRLVYGLTASVALTVAVAILVADQFDRSKGGYITSNLVLSVVKYSALFLAAALIAWAVDILFMRARGINDKSRF